MLPSIGQKGWRYSRCEANKRESALWDYFLWKQCSWRGCEELVGKISSKRRTVNSQIGRVKKWKREKRLRTRIRYVRWLENKWGRSWRARWYETREETVRSLGSQIKSDFGKGNVKQTPSFPFYSQINRDVISNKFPWISVTRFYLNGERKERKAEIRLLKIKMILPLFFNFFPMLPVASNGICNES